MSGVGHGEVSRLARRHLQGDDNYYSWRRPNRGYGVRSARRRHVFASPALPLTGSYLAATYDGSTLRRYVTSGRLAAESGAIATSADQCRSGRHDLRSVLPRVSTRSGLHRSGRRCRRHVDAIGTAVEPTAGAQAPGSLTAAEIRERDRPQWAWPGQSASPATVYRAPAPDAHRSRRSPQSGSGTTYRTGSASTTYVESERRRAGTGGSRRGVRGGISLARRSRSLLGSQVHGRRKLGWG